MEIPQLHRPVARRAFEITPTSADSSMPPSPPPETMNADLLAARHPEHPTPPSRTRSILNLTSSTLLGIYSGATDGAKEELNTPWGTGAQTPSIRSSMDADRWDRPVFNWNDNTRRPSVAHRLPRKGFKGYYLPLFIQTILLFGFGVGYGILITQMHRTQHIAAMPMPNEAKTSLYYHVAWGILGVLLGNALPRIDQIFEDDEVVANSFAQDQKPLHVRATSNSSRSEHEHISLSDSGLGPFWYSAVRSVGAFVGIAFALRRIPWQSTLQVSSTLAISNPVLWYLIDRSTPGFALASGVSAVGTFLMLLVNPDFVPVPHIHQEQASEQLGVYIWLASILFCTSLCFGAIGRRLQL